MIPKAFNAVAVSGALVLAACVAQQRQVVSSSAGMQLYEQSIREAAVRTPAFRVPLRSLERGAAVTVASFTEWGIPASPLERPMWVSAPAQLRELCSGKQDTVLAIQQILGLPPTKAQGGHQWSVITLTVPRQSIFRPCPGGTDIDAPQCSLASISPDLDESTARFLLNQFWSSHHVTFNEQGTPQYGYPWTGMGWSYDWDPTSTTHVGVSEYIVKKDTQVTDIRSFSPDAFCNGGERISEAGLKMAKTPTPSP